MALQPFLGLDRFFSFFILYTVGYKVGRTTWTGIQPIARPLSTHRTTQTDIKLTQTSMPWVGFKPTISVLERAKKVPPYTARPPWSAEPLYTASKTSLRLRHHGSDVNIYFVIRKYTIRAKDIIQISRWTHNIFSNNVAAQGMTRNQTIF
jgi:hypothetical protein